MYSNGFLRFLLPFGMAFLISSCGIFKKNNTSTNSKTSENSLREGIVSYGKKYLGTDYVYGGKTPKGFDCSGFTAHVYKKYNIFLEAGSKAQSIQGRKIPVKSVKTGDLIFFTKKKRGKYINHVSIVVSNTNEGISVIHSTSRGVVIDNITNSSYWYPRILFAKDVTNIKL